MQMTDAFSTALADRYAVERLIGEGGMAKVYLARDLRHHRRVALKVLRPDLGAVVGVDRFQAEIQVTANLQHPNLLPLFDSGVAGEMLFYVMPYVEGESLRARIEREKQLPVDEAIRISTAIAGALDYAHRQGVVHRDLKPENILLQEGQPLVADFGIALAISNAGGSRITQTGLSLGTPQYMSPEQATGDRAIDARTDIYSLGALTYEMLTGEPPHVGSTSQAIIARVLTERPRSIRATRPSVPEQVEASVDCALEKLPADRWATARDFADALNGVRHVTRSTGMLPSARSTAVSRASRSREIVAWSLFAAAAAALALASARAPRAEPPPVPAEFEVVLPDSLDLPTGGAASSIALSPDGRTLVFMAAKPHSVPMLYARRLGDRVVQELRGTEDARSPVFSPDGAEVLFSLPRTDAGSGVIKRIDIAGGQVRTVSDSGPRNGQVSWRNRDEIIMVASGGRTLLRVNPQSGNRTVLATADTARGVLLGFPDVLPGGNAALITIFKRRNYLDSTFIGVVSIPGGKITELGVRGLFPRYSMGRIVFATPGSGLYAVPFDTRALRLTGEPVLVAEDVSGGTGGAYPVAVAGNGTLAFIQGRAVAGQVQPVIASRVGTPRSIGATPGVYSTPRVSPDGREVALSLGDGFTAGSQMRNPDIWRMDVATGKSIRVTMTRTSDRPIWSRDGKELFFQTFPGDSTEYVIDLSANARPRAFIHATGAILSGDVGPAGGYAVWALTGPISPDVWIAPIDSLDKARVFAAEPYAESNPRISTDGRFVAYRSSRTGQPEIYIRRIVGANEEVKVSNEGGDDPVWSRDGRELFYRTPSPHPTMMAVQVTTSPKLAVSNERKLFALDGYSIPGGRASYDVFPNGDFLMLALAGETLKTRPPLVVRLNWASALEKASDDKKP